MKRILTFLFVTLMSIGAWAQHWTGPSDGDYIASTPVYVQVMVDGKNYLASNPSLELAAFIGDECRGVGELDKKGNLVVRVWGSDGSDGTTSDLNKDITFKAYCDGVEYQFTKTAKFDGNTLYPPMVLNLDLVGGAKLPASKEYTSTTFPYAIDLDSEAAIKYVDADGNEVETKGESEVLTQFTYSWGSLSSNITCPSSASGKFNVLAASDATSQDKVYVKLMDADGNQIGTQAECILTVTQEAIPVTDIKAYFTSLSSDVVTITEEEVRNRMIVVITPSDATNKEYELVPVDPTKKLFTADAVPEPGTYQYYVQSVSNPEVKTIINITVYSVPTEIQTENDIVYVKSTNTLDPSHFGKGSGIAYSNQYAIDAVLKEKLGNISILPSTANQLETKITQPAGSTPAFEKVSTWYKTAPVGEYSYRIESNVNPSVYKDFKVSVFTSAQLYVSNYTVDLPVGSTYQDLVDALGISVYPDYATYKDWEIVAPAGQESPAALKVFQQAGEFHYTVKLVTDPFSEASVANITVNIYNPVSAVVVNDGVTMKNGKGYFEVEPGDNVKELLINSAHVVPADAANADLQANVNTALYEEGIEDMLLDWEGKATDAEGEYEFLVSAVNYPDATPAAFIVKFLGNPHFVFTGENYQLSKYRDTEVTLTCTREIYDPSKVNLIFRIGEGDDSECVIAEKLDETGLKWKVRGLRNGSLQATVAYGDIEYNSEIIWNAWGKADWDKKEAVTMSCVAEMQLVKGWDWIAPNAGDGEGVIPFSAINFNKDNGDRIVEIRSQTDLLYNDPTDGIFGTISNLSTLDGMYKIKTESTSDVYDYVLLSEDYTVDRSAVKKITRRGYNWIGTGLQYSHYFRNIVDYLTPNHSDVSYSAQEGDRLIGKNGFAEFDGTEWLFDSDFIIEANKGYMYYTLSPQNARIDFCDDYESEYVYENEYALNGFPGAPIVEAKSVSAKKASVWNYDASQFADNMCIVAELNGMTGEEPCTIGAFVDGECRGKGRFVKGNKMFINVAGKAGEKVTFKLYDEKSDCFYDVDNVLTYSAMAGSLAKPVVLSSSSHATGINNVGTETSADKVAYDLSGRRVNTADKRGVYIVNGKKVLK